jgi:hypothetical protein
MKPPPQMFTEIGSAVPELLNGEDRQTVMAKLRRTYWQFFIENAPQI